MIPRRYRREVPSYGTGSAGLGVDYMGHPVVDPTENVKAMSEASGLRQDDLREYAVRLTEARLDGFERMADLRAEHIRLMSMAESRRIDEQSLLRADYTERLAIAEKQRIDAIRAVDVNAVSVANDRAAAQAQVLANQVQLSAEALRTLVSTTASTVAESMTQATSGLSNRITTLEQAQYEGKGKQAFIDPAIADLLSEVKQLRESDRQVAGKSEGISASWGVILGAATLLSVGIGFAALLLRTTAAPPAASTPQVVYIPTPATLPTTPLAHTPPVQPTQ